MDKKYSANVEKANLIKQLFNLKLDIKSIRADLAHYCFNLISIGFPNHPVLVDTSVCEEAPMEFSDLYACLDDSLKSNNGSSSDSGSDAVEPIYITKNAVSKYKVDNRSEAQIEAERLAAIKNGIKTEPVDNEIPHSTPIPSPMT